MNKIFGTILIFCFTVLSCNAAQETIMLPNSEKPVEITEQNTLPYDFSSTKKIPIELSIIEEITTKNPPNEGDIINFKATKNIFYNRKLIVRSGQIIPARVENIITSGMNGFPAEIVVNNFQIEGISQSQLISEYSKKGQNRCYWVYPLKWSLTLIPFVGSLTNFIMGGHAKIKTTDKITIYYYPQW
ncbi:MAG: hypothetical protein E7Z87_04630 [Cyanobacteria bacterium SIG26]|nr:hypothetical protein [Cyanobacteria bacterium SIG26]